MKVEAQLGLSTLVASATEHLPPLLTRLRSLKPSMDEVTEVLEHLSTVDSAFSEAQKKEIAAVVKSTMVDTATASARATAKTQQHLSLHNYLPAKLWACLESDDKRENKFRQLAEFMCQSLGLRNPDARTKRLAVVVVHLASNVSPAPKEAYEDVQMFGDIIEQKRTSVCSKQTMLAFPEDPKVFMVSYPTAFGAEDPPIACRVSLASTVERCRKGVTPCRNSNQQVRVHFAKPPTIGQATLAASSSNDSVNGALLSILERYMFQNKEHSPLGGGGCLRTVRRLSGSIARLVCRRLSGSLTRLVCRRIAVEVSRRLHLVAPQPQCSLEESHPVVWIHAMTSSPTLERNLAARVSDTNFHRRSQIRRP